MCDGMQASYSAAGSFFYVQLQPSSSSSSSLACFADKLRLAIVTVMLDSSGTALDRTVFPYYGSAEKQRFLAPVDGRALFQDTFRPYTEFTMDYSVPRYALGYPRVVSITDTGLAVHAQTESAAWPTRYAVVRTSLVPQLSSSSNAAPEVAVVVQALMEFAAGSIAAVTGALDQVGPFPLLDDGDASADALKLWAAVTGLDPGAEYTLILSTGHPCALEYTVVSGIFTPDTRAPSFLSARVTSPCQNVDTATDSFSLALEIVTDEPADVWVAAFRHYPALSAPATPLTPSAVISGAATLDIAECSDAGWAGFMSIISPCRQAGASSGSTGTAKAGGGFSGTVTLTGTMHPTAQELEAAGGQRCVNSTLFRVSSDQVDVYIVARDLLPNYRDLEDVCAPAPAQGATTAVFAVRCRYAATMKLTRCFLPIII